MRIVIVTRILPVALGFHAAVREMGHEPVALLTIRDPDQRYGPWDVAAIVEGAPADLDVLFASRRSSIAPLSRSLEPDLVVCMGLPWKIPVDALAVPRVGWLNGHPSLLPEHRGPVPIAWAIRDGDEETGVTYHFMDADLDTGPIVVQRRFPIGEYVEPDDFYGRIGPVMVETLAEALRLIESGDRGTPQPDGGRYETFFAEEDVWLDRRRPALEMHRLAWAWRYTIALHTEKGLLVELGDERTARITRSSLEELDGATRIECVDAPLWVLTEPVVPPIA